MQVVTKVSVWLSMLAAAALGGRIVLQPSCDCGLIRPAAAGNVARIIGGNESRINAYPWTVGLLANSWDKRPFCGGVLISNRHILTAAHCLDNTDASFVTVGDHDVTIQTEAQSYLLAVKPYATKFEVMHAKYDSGHDRSIPTNDMAMLELSSPLRFRSWNEQVRPICLPEPHLNTDRDESGNALWATVAGWGLVKAAGEQSKTLQHVRLKVITNSECQQRYDDHFPGGIKDTHLCTYAEGKDACQGDSGGALFAPRSVQMSLDGKTRQEAIGIVSFGDGCGTPGKPGGFSRVSKFLPWIMDRMMGSAGDVVVCQGTFGKWMPSSPLL